MNRRLKVPLKKKLNFYKKILYRGKDKDLSFQRKKLKKFLKNKLYKEVLQLSGQKNYKNLWILMLKNRKHKVVTKLFLVSLLKMKNKNYIPIYG